MISIVVPCMNEEEALPLFYAAVQEVICNSKELTQEGIELLFVDDGSCDNTLNTIKNLASQDTSVRYLAFSRNFGKEAAIYAGMEHAKGDYVCIMDADLQDPPALLPTMYKAVTEEGYDSAATRRVTRKGEPAIRSLFARIFYRIMNRISKTEVMDGARDYRLMNRKFVNAILSLSEYNRFSKGLFGWVGFKTKWIEFENVKRCAGETKWSFWKLLIYAIDGITSFSTAPLVTGTVCGLSFSGIAFLALIFFFVRRLVFGDPVAGWASTICVILFLGGIQLFFIGILGQYLAKVYKETKHRPLYITSDSNIDLPQ